MRALPRPFSAAEVATLVGGVLAGPDVVVTAVATLDEAGPGHLAFHDRGSPGSASLLLGRSAVPGRAVVVVPEPILALSTLLEECFPEWRPEPGAPPVHPSARVHPSATLHPGVVLGPGVEVGPDCTLFPNVVLYANVRLGARVRVHANAVIGADGFRYEPTAAGLRRVPHVGGVVVGDDAEIGACACVDRGMLGDTVIGRGAKIDNLVQVGHNCTVGDHAVLVAQVGLSGSVRVGRGAILAGQVGVADHRQVGDGARLGARSAVHTDIPAGETWLGEPARPVREAMRVYAALRYLPELVRRLGPKGS